MPFVALPAPAGDGTGAAQDVTGLNPDHVFTLSALQPPAGGLLLIEGSNDAAETDFVPVAKFDLLQFAGFDVLPFNPRAQIQSLGPPIKTRSAWRRLRVRRLQVPSADSPPVVNVGADASPVNVFATLPVLASDGAAALVDVSVFPNVKTFHVGGTMPEGTIFVEASQNGGVTFDEIARFDGPWAAPNLLAPLTVEAEFSHVRTVRTRSLPGGNPSVHLGAGDVALTSGITSINGQAGPAIAFVSPMLTVPAANTIAHDNANVKVLPAPFVAADITTDTHNGFLVPKLSANLVMPNPTITDLPTSRQRMRKVTLQFTQEAVTRTVTFPDVAGGYRWGKAGATVGPTQAQFDAQLAAMLNDERIHVGIQYNLAIDRWEIVALAGPYV